MKKRTALLLSAIMIGSAALGGCSGNSDGDGSGLFGSFGDYDKSSAQSVSASSEESSKEESSKEESSKEESSKEESSKEESSKEESSKEESSKEESSKEESSKEESSKEESSKEESVPSQYDIEYEKLQYFLDNYLEKDGSEPYAVTYNNETHVIPGYTLNWEFLTGVIADFNSDNSPELVVQYGVSPKEGWDKQGIALRIIKYQDRDYREYQARNFIEYTRIAGAGYASTEIVDELYVDENGDLAVLHTRTAGTSPVSAVYYTYSLRNGALNETNNLYVMKEGYYGQSEEEIYEHEKMGYAIADGECCIFGFSRMEAPPPEPHIYFSPAEGRKMQRKIMSLDLVSTFKVDNAIVHHMEKQSGYDTANYSFVSFEEMLSLYNSTH